MRSNCAYWRTSPAANFYLEGLSKLIMLVLVGYLSIGGENNNGECGVTNKNLEILLSFIVLGHCLHELGELEECSWNPSEYLLSVSHN